MGRGMRMRQRRGQTITILREEYKGWGPETRLSSVREGDKDKDALGEDDDDLRYWLLRRCENDL